MILTCPNCSSRFLLSAQVLAPEGRRVKCSNCSEEWFQEPDYDELTDNEEQEIEDIPEAVKPIPEGSSVPALPDEEGREDEAEKESAGGGAFAGYVGAAGVFTIVLAGLIFMKPQVLSAWPPAAGFYQMIGMDVRAPGEGLVFDQVESRLASNDTMMVKGQVINLTSDVQALPVIEATLRDEASNVLHLWHIAPPYETLDGEASLPFKATYEGDMSNADHVQLRFILGEAGDAQPNMMEPKTDEEGGDNTPAPPADDHAH